ncbi:MAG: hypothetical protein ACJ8G7_17135 [Rhizobacter sp.]
MISRLTSLAALFAIVTTASLAYAANAQLEQRAAAAALAQAPVVQLEPVLVIGHRQHFDLTN